MIVDVITLNEWMAKMRPCNTCRAPTTNDRLHCEECEPALEVAPQVEIWERHEEGANSTSIHSWLPQFFENTVYAGVIVAVAIMVIGTPIGMLLGNDRIGIVLGCIVGPVIGLAFALLELSQSE